MELQDFAPKHLVAQLAYAENDGSIVDRRGTIAEAIGPLVGAGSASLDATAAVVIAENERDKYRIGIAQIVASILSIDDMDQTAESVREFMTKAMELAENPKLGSVKAHTSDIAPVASFDELRDALADRLTPNLAGLRDSIGVKLDDVGWHYNFKDDESTVEVRFGPMTDIEVRALVGDLEEIDYPPFVMLLDVKTILRSGKGAEGDPVEWWGEALRRNRRMVERAGNWLKETVA